MSTTQKNLIVLVGPTAVGKSAMAVALAERFSAAVVSADARQLFREMNIGTAKPGEDLRRRAEHYFIDSHSIHTPYDAASFEQEALTLIGEQFATRDVLVLAGGSGLYVKAVCEGLDDIPPVPAAIREKIVEGYETGGLGWLRQRFFDLSPEPDPKLDLQNPRRLMRALEVIMATGRPLTFFQQGTPAKRDFRILKIGLEMDRQELYQRIDQRMDEMLAQGLFEEAAGLYPYRHLTALQTVGYQEVFGYIEGRYDREEAIRLMKRNSRRYAKRQMTWFKKDSQINWFSPGQTDDILTFVNRWLQA